MTELNEAIHNLLDEMTIGEAFELLAAEEFTAADDQRIFGVFLEAATKMFAEKYSDMDDEDAEGMQRFFEAFVTFENIPSELSEAITIFINEASKHFDEDSDNKYEEDEESDDNNDQNDFVISQKEWNNLSSEQRLKKVKAFLAAVANSGSNFGGAAPFIKPGLGNQKDPYGNVFGSKVKVFDRKINNFGHGPDNPTTPSRNSYLQTESVSRKHFETTANIIRAIENPQKRQEWANHHARLFASQNPRFDAAKFHKAAGTKYSGKTTIKEGTKLHNLPIQENLFSPEAHKRVEAYARFMDTETAYTKNVSVHGGMAEDLREAGAARDKHDKLFDVGQNPAEWDSSITREKGKRK